MHIRQIVLNRWRDLFTKSKDLIIFPECFAMRAAITHNRAIAATLLAINQSNVATHGYNGGNKITTKKVYMVLLGMQSFFFLLFFY